MQLFLSFLKDQQFPEGCLLDDTGCPIQHPFWAQSPPKLEDALYTRMLHVIFSVWNLFQDKHVDYWRLWIWNSWGRKKHQHDTQFLLYTAKFVCSEATSPNVTGISCPGSSVLWIIFNQVLRVFLRDHVRVFLGKRQRFHHHLPHTHTQMEDFPTF